MINNDELYQKLQTASYKIIYESISEEERIAMNLTPDQIIPTISFLGKVQAELFRRFCEDKAYLGRSVEYEYCFEKYNFVENKFFIEPEVINVNLSFLKALCQNAGLEFYTFEDRYHFETSNGNIYHDVKKKYHI